MHQSRRLRPRHRAGPARSPARSWTAVFGDELVRIGEQRDDVVAITAAMCEPTGLGAFARRFPDRFYDVGIAEQHAMTSAAGLAMGGLHPVVAVYATFLNRAFDQLLMDVALHRLPVTVVLDRAGITGDDGPSHNGMWDLALLGMVPGLRHRRAARRGRRCASCCARRSTCADGPTVLRFPKTPLGDDRAGRCAASATIDVLAEPDADAAGRRAARRRRRDGRRRRSSRGRRRSTAPATRSGSSTRAGSPRSTRRWSTSPGRPGWSSRVEDGVVTGGVGVAHLRRPCATPGIDVPTREIGIPVRFLEHGSVAGRPGAGRAHRPGHRAADRGMVGASIAPDGTGRRARPGTRSTARPQRHRRRTDVGPAD